MTLFPARPLDLRDDVLDEMQRTVKITGRSCREWSIPRPSLPACPAEALHLRFAREDPTAVQADELPDTLGPPIAGGGRCRAVQMRHLSVTRHVVGARQYRVGTEGARRAQ